MISIEKHGVYEWLWTLLIPCALIFLRKLIEIKRKSMIPVDRLPPMVPTWIPYVGSAIAFWSDSIGFLRHHSENLRSDIFGAIMWGKVFYFVTDPHAAAYLTSGRIRELSWVEAKARMLTNGLGASPSSANRWITEADLRKEHRIVESHLSRTPKLVDYCAGLRSCLPTILDDLLPLPLKHNETNQINTNESGGQWHRAKLLDVVGQAIYRATIETLFGYRSLATPEDYANTMKFERRFPKFTGISSQWMQSIDRVGYGAREAHVKKMVKMYQKFLDTNRNTEPPSPSRQKTTTNGTGTDTDDTKQDFLGDLPRDYGNAHAHQAMELEDVARFHYLFFVASYYNTIPAAFWSIFEIIRDPNAYAACLGEISKFREVVDDNDNPPTVTVADYDSMTVLDSVISEAMRLRSTTKMLRLRYATEDFTMRLEVSSSADAEMSTKRIEFPVAKGTYFVSCPQLMHTDPEIFEDPYRFQYDRFLGKPVFRKDGRPLLRPVDAFGGGGTMCPGRKFAVLEIKALMNILLQTYELRFPNGSPAPHPPLNTVGIVNTGMPIHDVDIEYRRREK